MFQFAFEAVLFQLRARGPSSSPLFALPNRRQTPPRRQADPLSFPICHQLLNHFFMPPPREYPGEDPRTPYTAGAVLTGESRRTAKPRCQSASEAVWLQRRARGPASSPSAAEPNRRQTATIPTFTHMASHVPVAEVPLYGATGTAP